jgi:hypothetical protein
MYFYQCFLISYLIKSFLFSIFFLTNCFQSLYLVVTVKDNDSQESSNKNGKSNQDDEGVGDSTKNYNSNLNDQAKSGEGKKR